MTVDTIIGGPYGSSIDKYTVYGHLYKFSPSFKYDLRTDYLDRLGDPVVNYIKRNA